MIKLCRILIAAVFFIGFYQSRGQAPHLKGEVEISIKEGTIKCDWVMSNYPRINNYSIRINSGFNVRYFRNIEDTYNYNYQKYFEPKESYEAFQYYFVNDTAKYLPEEMQISYMGMYPVASDTLKSNDWGDWKGNIAFNGSVARLSEQTAWYPILYDIDNDILYDKVTYDINVSCVDCESIYINGVAPKQASQGNFRSEKAFPLMLFAGNYSFDELNTTYFLNTTLSKIDKEVLSKWTSDIIKYYEKSLSIPYGGAITYLGTTPISKKNAWMFVTFPTIAVVGRGQYDISQYFDIDEELKILNDSSSIDYIAHELGHYYFGSKFIPNSSLKWVFLEGLTEYLALQVTRELLGENSYQKKLDNYYKNIEKEELPQLNLIKDHQDVNEAFRYSYIPLVLTAIEREIGKKQMFKWLNLILNTEGKFKTDYAFFKNSIIKSGVAPEKYDVIEKNYIASDAAKANVISKIKSVK